MEQSLVLMRARSDDHWIDYDFFGHQLVCHVGEVNSFSNEVDGKEVPNSTFRYCA